MEPIVELAVALGRLSRLDSKELLSRHKTLDMDLEDLLHGGGYLDAEEYDWMTQIALQDYGIGDLEKFQRQWFLARVAWSENLFPKGAEVLPRLLLKNWAQRRSITLAKLVAEKGYSSECVFKASQLLASQLTICVHCLKVLRVRQGVPCPFCQGGRAEISSDDQALWDLYRCLRKPDCGLEMNIERLEQNARKLLGRIEKLG